MEKQNTKVYRGLDGRDDEQVNQYDIIKLAVDYGKHMLFIDVGLNDDVLIYNAIGEGPHVAIEGQSPRKYIIIKHTFANTWGNNVEVIFTDEDEEAEAFEDDYSEYTIKLEEEEEEAYIKELELKEAEEEAEEEAREIERIKAEAVNHVAHIYAGPATLKELQTGYDWKTMTLEEFTEDVEKYVLWEDVAADGAEKLNLLLQYGYLHALELLQEHYSPNVWKHINPTNYNKVHDMLAQAEGAQYLEHYFNICKDIEAKDIEASKLQI